MNTHGVKMAQDVKMEMNAFDKLMSDCEATLNRKTDIIIL